MPSDCQSDLSLHISCPLRNSKELNLVLTLEHSCRPNTLLVATQIPRHSCFDRPDLSMELRTYVLATNSCKLNYKCAPSQWDLHLGDGNLVIPSIYDS
ncbi:rCG30434 [Rattus norvegicus]|uniref:RCG30434 n=1 Tax=Rattus norvegicus TaxID=10116 RepID=A6JF88_RAT|nr:rCG30434 [Rattus norvegicus]